MTAAHFNTLVEPLRFEPDKVKGSRFIADLAPVTDEEAAQAFVEQIARDFHDARHHCFAWRLGTEGKLFRSSDDGEPSGSAGRPILQQLEGHELTDVCCVVTRYFGGTKLGVGGLMRAYGGAAGMACDRASIRQVVITRALHITHPYGLSGPVQGILTAHALEPQNATYGELVQFTVHLPIHLADGFLEELTERTAGRVQVEEK